MKYLLSTLLLWNFLFAQSPDLFLLKSYDEKMDVTGWLMSEKLDGIRAYWDGEKLISRGGRVFDVPGWFVRNFPPFAIDGELWTKRDDFEHIASIVNTRHPHSGWKEITYNIFDVPNTRGGLMQRLQRLQGHLNVHPDSRIRIIPQRMVRNKQELKNFFNEIIRGKGEGVVLRKPDVPYYVGRKSESLKYKNFSDDECVVTGYTPGKGKLEGFAGALECRWQQMIIRIGSGLTKEEREHPPKIGDTITFKYWELTKKGKPKYPVFLRVRYPHQQLR